MSSQRKVWLALLVACVAGCLFACKGNPRSSKTEDEARSLIPVPICLQRLPRRAAPGSVVSLTSKEYWSFLLPGYDNGATLDLAVPDCSGRLTLGEAPSGNSRVSIHPDEMVLGTGSDGFKIVWLPVRTMDNVRSGLLALLRQRQEYLEVYALGIHQGSLSQTKFAMERMGPALVVTSQEESCQGSDAARRCASACTVYLAGNGRLVARAKFPTDRTVDARATTGPGMAEYRFTASATYRSDGIALSEKLSVSEKGRGEVRSIDLERVLRLQADRLQPSAESLWVQTAKELGLSEGR